MAVVDGEFWLSDAPDVRRAGSVEFDPQVRPQLTTQGALVPLMKLVDEKTSEDGSVTSQFEPHFDRTPRTIFGIDDAGTPLTLLETQNSGYRGIGAFEDAIVETRIATHVVFGAHLNGRGQQFTGLRVRMQLLNLALKGGTWTTGVNLKNGATLTSSSGSSGSWLQLEDLPATTLRGMDRLYLRPLVTLLTLASGSAAAVLELEVRVEPGQAWLQVHSRSHQSDDAAWPDQALLRPALARSRRATRASPACSGE